MAKDKLDTEQPDAMKAAVLDALKGLRPEELKDLLTQAGLVPTTMGMDAKTLDTLMKTMSGVSAQSMKEALRSQRKENPNYPERSVFHPEGKYSDEGEALPAKVAFTRDTFFNNVRLGGELETPLEIQLCNQLTESRTARDGTWKAVIGGDGLKKTLHISVPSNSADERNELPSFTQIVRELVSGAEAADPDAMAKRLEALEAQVKAMGAQPAA